MSATTRSYIRYFEKFKEVSVWVDITFNSSGGSCVWKTENLGRQWQHGSDIHWNTIVSIRWHPIEPHIGRPDRYWEWPKGSRIHSKEGKKTSQLASRPNCIGGVDKLLQLKVSAEWSIFVMIGCISLLFQLSQCFECQHLCSQPHLTAENNWVLSQYQVTGRRLGRGEVTLGWAN